MALQKIKGIIFDLDGTLADTMGDLTVSMNEMLSHYGFPHRTHDELLGFINRGALNFVKSSLPTDTQSDDTLVHEAFEIYNKAYMNHYSETTYLYEGIYDTVTKLAANNIKLAVLSNKQHMQTNAIVNKLFDAGTFDSVIGYSNFPHKPDPTAVFHIADKLNIKTDDILFVGDSDVDIKTAINSGTYPIGVSWGYRSPELLIETGAKKIIYKPAELLKLI